MEFASEIASLGMVVDGEFRGQGIGTALLATGIDWSRDYGAHKVTLEVDSAQMEQAQLTSLEGHQC